MSLKLCRAVFESISRQARAAQKAPSQHVRSLIEADAAMPVRLLQSGVFVGDYITVAVRVRTSTVDQVKAKADSMGLRPSQLIRALLEDHVLRCSQTRDYRKAG